MTHCSHTSCKLGLQIYEDTQVHWDGVHQVSPKKYTLKLCVPERILSLINSLLLLNIPKQIKSSI